MRIGQFDYLRDRNLFMIYFPNTKINIGLNIIEKRTDGYHNIESIFYPIPIHDILEINLNDTFNFTSSGLLIKGNNEQNLVVKAYRLMVEQFQIGTVNIHLHKQIPMGAGLGGGSADGASTLVLLNDLFKLNLSSNTLEELAFELGSDCPFFIKNQAQYVTSRGEKLQPIDSFLKGYYLYLVNDGVHISTKEAYSKITPGPTDQDLRQLIQSPVNDWRTCIKNDFEIGAFQNHPQLNDIKAHLYRKGADYAAMTGSGSTIFGLFSSKPEPDSKWDFEKIVQLV